MVLPSYYFGFEDDNPARSRSKNWNNVTWASQGEDNGDPCLIYCPDPVDPGRFVIIGSAYGVDDSFGRLHPCRYCGVPLLHKMNYCLQCGAPRYSDETLQRRSATKK